MYTSPSVTLVHVCYILYVYCLYKGDVHENKIDVKKQGGRCNQWHHIGSCPQVHVGVSLSFCELLMRILRNGILKTISDKAKI